MIWKRHPTLRAVHFRLLGLLGFSLLAFAFCADPSGDIDPFDMENFDPVEMKMKKMTETVQDANTAAPEVDHLKEASSPPEPAVDVRQEPVEACQSSQKDKIVSCPAQYLFQQFVSRLLHFVRNKVQQANEDTTDLCLRLRLSPHELQILESFKMDSSGNSILHSAHDVLTHAIYAAHSVGAEDPSLQSLWMEDKLGLTVEKATQVVMLAVLCLALLLLLMKVQLGVRFFMRVCLLATLISVMMTWYRLYKGEVAKQHETLMQDLPSGCAKMPEDSSHLKSFLNLYKYYFTFQKDSCVEYYEHLIVDPIVKVSIMEAFAVALVQTLLKPMRTVGTELSEFLRALLKDLPVQWQLCTVVSVFVFAFLVMLLCCGYRVRIPLLLAIEPSHVDKAREVEHLRHQVCMLQSKVENIGATGTRHNGNGTQAALPASDSTVHTIEAPPAPQPRPQQSTSLMRGHTDRRNTDMSDVRLTAAAGIKTGNMMMMPVQDFEQSNKTRAAETDHSPNSVVGESVPLKTFEDKTSQDVHGLQRSQDRAVERRLDSDQGGGDQKSLSTAFPVGVSSRGDEAETSHNVNGSVVKGTGDLRSQDTMEEQRFGSGQGEGDQ